MAGKEKKNGATKGKTTAMDTKANPMLLALPILVVIAAVSFYFVMLPQDSSPAKKAAPSSEKCVQMRYEVFTSQHSACLPKSTDAHPEKGGISEEDKILIVNKHNEYRRKQQATGMQTMVWDDELAFLAQKWAENCVYGHEMEGSYRRIPGKYSTGQNMARGWDSWEVVIDSWYSEINDFVYGDANANDLRVIGHYTQVVWDSSARVGCAKVWCDNIQDGLYYVCDYGSLGNYPDYGKPYNKGETCADCPDSCKDGLCDCGGKVCYNGGKLNTNSCQCECKYPEYHLPMNCEVNCTAAVDINWCEQEQFQTGCLLYDNVPDDCPHHCEICPYGGHEYV